jgi:hypothetical protein
MRDLNKSSKNLLLIDYPSGGYGYYLARLINSFVTNVVPTADLFEFDQLGTSHLLPLVAGDIHHEQNRNLYSVNECYQRDIDQQKYILIPYCPGIQNDTTTNLEINFPNAKIVRLCYHDNTWPLIFQNCIVKAAAGTLETDVEFDSKKFGSGDNWARRENFSLLFENHHYRNMWKEYDHARFLNIDIFELLTNPHCCLLKVANFINGSIYHSDRLLDKHQQFLDANPNTITHLEILQIINSLTIEQDLMHVEHLYHQAVMNFYIQTKFNFVIPSNDYANWFTNTKEIVTMLTHHGVNIDLNL